MQNKPRVLYVNHSEERCGVYQFGRNVAGALSASTKFDFRYFECSTPEALNARVLDDRPIAVIYNYHPDTLAWAKWTSIFGQVPQIATVHEVYQQLADGLNDYTFDYYIAPDPTLLLKNPIVFKTGRLIPDYRTPYSPPPIPTIGSFGFGTSGKGFEDIVRHVQDEFDDAVIRFNIPFARFGDADGARARTIASNCRALVSKPGIRLEIGHDFLEDDRLLDFLATNSMNVFLYAQGHARGISSVIEYALAVDRPIAVSESRMFRHVHGASPSIVFPRSSLRRIMSNGVAPLRQFKEEYTRDNLIWDYERIVETTSRRGRTQTALQKLSRLFLSKTNHRRKAFEYFSWAAHDRAIRPFVPSAPHSSFVDLPIDRLAGFNRILDDSARSSYGSIVDQIWKFVPSIMKSKIPEANVQQAFVLDTAIKLARNYVSPKILAVGSYQDSAVATLKILGYDVTEIDPVLNYDLHTFLTKPSSSGQTFDLVISTSVIEHVLDDVQFCRDIVSVLRPGGLAILTCDFNDQYRPGDDIPDVDYRWYTQRDIKERLLPAIPDCRLYDEPNWACPAPDFVLVKRYRYSFASIVFQKLFEPSSRPVPVAAMDASP
jgi:hypothetical protein